MLPGPPSFSKVFYFLNSTGPTTTICHINSLTNSTNLNIGIIDISGFKLMYFQLFDDRRQLIAEQAAAAQGRTTSPVVAMDEINKVKKIYQNLEQ